MIDKFKISKKELTINVLLALVILIVALLTSFPYIRTIGSFLSNFPAKSYSRLIYEQLASNILPGFRYNTYQIELNEVTPIELFITPTAQKVIVEIISAEGIGLTVDSAKLLKEGLKFVKPKRPREQVDRFSYNIRDEVVPNRIIFNLREIENKAQVIQAIDFNVYRILVKGKLPGQYTIKATVDDKDSALTTIITKPGLRIDYINPHFIEAGNEALFTITGKGLDNFCDVIIEGNDISVKNMISIQDGIFKVTLAAPLNASPGFRDITISNPLKGVTSVLVDGLEIKSTTAAVDVSPIQGPQGEEGLQGIAGKDGMSICDSPTENLMVFTNNLPPGNSATAFFDPVQCNLTFGIPVGFNGINGNDGFNGMGVCSDKNATLAISSNTLPEGSMATSNFDPSGCTLTLGVPKGDTGATGVTGATGSAGINCWDLNGNGANDSNEDINMDSSYSALDCIGANINTVEYVIANWDSLSDEQNFTTASGNMTRMIKIPYFINDGVIYGGFWIDKYEASRANATPTTEGNSTVPVSQRNVVPWANINLSTAQSVSNSSSRQISEIGSCMLIGMRQWHALYLLGRYSKISSIFGASSTNGWNERGNTRSGEDGRASVSYTCTDDPTENAGGTGRCLTGTGYKSWGHLLDSTSSTNVQSGNGAGQGVLGGTADSIKDNDDSNGADTFDGDLQVYDLVGNVDEWIDFTLTRTSNTTKIDSGYQAAGEALPYSTNNRYFSFDDIAGGTNTTYIDFQGLGLPYTGVASNQADLNGGINDGKLLSNSTNNQQYGTVRGGSWTTNVDSRSPLYLDISASPTTAQTNKGFRVICNFAN